MSRRRFLPVLLLAAAALACASRPAAPTAGPLPGVTATAAPATVTALPPTTAPTTTTQPATETSVPTAAAATATQPPTAAATVTAPASATVPAAATALPAFNPALLGRTERDVTYCTVGGVDLKMDVYYPASAPGPWPVTVFIHGGGWSEGDKNDSPNLDSNKLLGQAGFLQVSLDYRLAPQYPFPAQIEDVKCAIRHLRANAAHYNLDPRRLGAVGASAGAHLAALLGVDDQSAGWDVGQYLDQSSQVQAVVTFFAPFDLTKDITGVNEVGVAVFGTTDHADPRLTIASPVTYVSASSAPFYLIHGEQDHFVPPEQSQEMYDRLTAAGVPAELLFVKNMGHAFTPVGGQIDPSLPEQGRLEADYFVKELGR